MKHGTSTVIYSLLLLASFFAAGISQTTAKDTVHSVPMSTGQLLQHTVIALADEIRSSISGSEFSRIAVMPFTTLLGEENVLGLYISDKLTSELSVGEDNLQLVERSQINQALAEMRLGETGFLSEETIQKTGQALGADAVIVGTIVEIGEEVDINLRVFSVSTLKILGKASRLIEKNEVIKSLLLRPVLTQEVLVTQSDTAVGLVTEEVEFLFSDDFERDEALGEWQPRSGEWLMVDGAIAQNSYSAPAFVSVGRDHWRNYTLEARIRGIDGQGPLIGVRFNEQSGECVVWNVGGGTARHTLIQMFNLETGAHRNLPGMKKTTVAMGKWYQIKMVVQGGTVKCFMDGQLVLTLSDPEIARLRKGKIALGTWKSRAFFDEVRVTKLE